RLIFAYSYDVYSCSWKALPPNSLLREVSDMEICWISPFPFILVMEGLHLALKDAVHANLFHGSKVFRVSHFFYADDVVIISDWSSNVISILHDFYLALGLKVNTHKSNVFGIGVSSKEVSYLARGTGCTTGIFPFTYLGLPIGSNESY
ncbi:hypothetical protein Tco_0218243, partial [Tanacetum coccineum]